YVMIVKEINKVSIIGLGLIGGSIGMCLRNKGILDRVIGIPRREETIDQAKKKGAISEGTMDMAAGVADADIVFICTPITLIIPTLEKIKGSLKEGAIVTDVGSTKKVIVEKAEKIMGPNTHFIGGHPMAGSDRFGIGAAHTFLFDNANWILTPSAKADPDVVETLKTFLEKMDAKVHVIKPDYHDFLVAGISHMPLMVAISLVKTVSDIGDSRDKMLELAATGFRDTTRIASGHPVLGKDMCDTNQEMILELIKRFKASLANIEYLIRERKLDELEDEFTRIKKVRDSIYTSG
ncbi:MAG: prephenate dehydrogenase/arogenate dehydrogenase family protein, partial [bacterium]